MALEATVAERLQELRQWQVAQQERLLQQQREQRENLCRKQDRTCRALGLSFGDVVSPDKDNSNSEGGIVTDATMMIKKPPDRCAMPFVKYRTMPEKTEDKPSSGKIAQVSENVPINEETTTKNTAPQSSGSTAATIEAVKPLSFAKLTSPKFCNLLDDTPVPSVKKDFTTLLEEQLRDTTVLPNAAVQPGHESNKQVRRPFLRKGQGLIRYCSSRIPKNPLHQRRTQAQTCPNLLPENTKINTKNNIRKQKSNKTPLNDPVQHKLNLRGVSAPAKVRSGTASTISCIPWTSEASGGSDRESKTKRELEEVRIFELLEEKAENSSFCSTSSTVVALLRQSVQSTPLKPRGSCNEQWQTPSLTPKTEVAAEESSLEEIVRTSASNCGTQDHCATIMRDQEPLTNGGLIEAASSLHSFDHVPVISVLDNQRVCCDLVPYGTDFETDGTENGHKTINDASLRVRFSDYNEYRTIDLTDDSTVSTDAEEPTIVYSDDRAWSDCSTTTESSDVDLMAIKLPSLKITSTCESDFETPLNEEEDERSTAVLSVAATGPAFNTRRTSSLAAVISEEVSSRNAMMKKEELEGEENGDAPVFFKSELLKSRLVELEREIEIFRRENAALAEQRRKLQEDREEWERQLKAKEKILADRGRSADDLVQEEKRKLARDKASLEVRLKDAQARAQQSKQERLETQNLRVQLEELKEELVRKESRWNAAVARHRSQQRILQDENSRLTQEIRRLQSKGHHGFKVREKPSSFASAKALHRINEQLDRQRRALPKEEENEDAKRSSSVEEDRPRSSLSRTGTDYVPNPEPSVPTHANIDPLTTNARPLEDSGIVRRKRVDLTPGNDRRTAKVKDSGTDTNIANNSPNLRKDSVCSNDVCHDLMKTDGSDNGVSPEGSKGIETIDQVPSVGEHSNLSFYRNRRTADEHAVKEVQHSDGRKEFWYPNGNVKKVSADKLVSRMIYYNGDVRESKQDGSIKYFYAATRTWHTTMPDGLEILEFPDGQVERRSTNGTIEVSLPDGSVRTLHADGSERWALPDGTVADTLTNGGKILTLPNGQREVHTEEHKRREYPDGTVKLVYPDGTQETRYANGRIRLKAQDGSLIMDSHHR